jgi:hypothetical protein
MNTIKPFQLGSISHGTLRTQDLLEAFTDVLNSLDKTNPLIAEALDLIAIGDKWNGHDEPTIDWTDDQEESASILVNESLPDALQELCPPFVYFGTLEGDGSDFGFWPDIESLQEDLEYNGRPMLGDSEYTHLDDAGLLVHISDHGNVSVFDQQGNLIWDCV